MLAKYLGVTLVLASLVTGSHRQWPLGKSFYTQMNQMQRDLNRMVSSMRTNMQNTQVKMNLNKQAMNERMARQRQYVLENSKVHLTRNYGTGGRTFTTSNGGTGYVYNSPDGSVNIFSYNSGPQHSGSVYHSGPDGTYFRRW